MNVKSLACYWGIPLLFLASLNARAYTIEDTYIGADDHDYGDVIGDASIFDIDHLITSLSGTILTVDIYTNFAGEAGVYSTLTDDGNGIGYGDLFLSSTWNPYGTEPYELDDASTGTQWEYAISLDNRWADGGVSSLYALTNATGEVLTSNDFLDTGIFRDNQEVAINTTGLSALTAGSWSVNETDGFIRFVMDISATTLLGGDIAIHWGPTCANDVIEGVSPVPVPGAMVLMLSGLLGMAGIGMRGKITS